MASGHLLLYNFTGLEQDVARIAREADVVYAIVLDAEGLVAAHSRRPDTVGRALDGEVDRRAAHRARSRSCRTLVIRRAARVCMTSPSP